MQMVNITASTIFNAVAVTQEMLYELAASPFVGYSQDAIGKLATQKLAKGSKHMQDLPMAKLRTCVVQRLQDNNDINVAFKAGTFVFEFNCLQEPDINQAGTNKQRRASGGKRQQAGAYTGAYVVANRNGLKCTAETDPGKWAIWQHVWACNSFEEFFAKAPQKSVTKTQRVITAYSEINWAVKSGWIKPVAAQQ